LKRGSESRQEQAPVEIDLTSDGFVPLALAAFDSVVRELGFQLAATTDRDAHALVDWRNQTRRLRVADDRDAQLIEIFVVRAATEADKASARMLVHDGAVWLPLWAIVKASGGDLGPILSGRRRLQYLTAAADALREYASPFLMFDQAPVDGVVNLITRNRV
jgi:hypothetical protein